MSTYIVVFVTHDHNDDHQVTIDGVDYEPADIRLDQSVEVAGPFATKRSAQAYAAKYRDMDDCTITVQELQDPKADVAA